MRRHEAASPPIRWFRTLRICVLTLLLILVTVSTFYDRYRTTRWREPLFVALYPIAADDSMRTRRYVASLNPQTFESIDLFFKSEAQRYRLRTLEPFRTRLQEPLATLPPERPAGHGMASTAWWSLRLRYWAWQVTRHAHEPADVRIFVLYHDPALIPTVPHSLGLAKGLIGVVYAFAAPSMSDENDIVIAHELLHTVGATDKYSAVDDAPRFPDGFGDPLQNPLYPQRNAELMAGRRMLSPSRWVQASSLHEVIIGPATAAEIRWQ